MQYRKILLSGFACLVFLTSLPAQQAPPAALSGSIKDSSGKPVSAASIRIKGSTHGTFAGEDGGFMFRIIKPGKLVLEITAVGFARQSLPLTIKPGEQRNVSIVLTTDATHMAAVSVQALSANKQAARQAYAITAIDTRVMHNSSLDLNQVLGKTAGVRVREDGGLGSSFSFSLNGFSGRQVKFFLDGIPMDNFGSSLTLNNLPINLAERIEVYKGVVPIWLGADALGGAVNVITNNRSGNFIDVSYTYGSFNTHRSSVSAGMIAPKSGFTVSANLFQNYSDNNYWVHTGITDLNSLVIGPVKRLRRFHDRYKSETAQFETGFSGRKFADKLLVGIILSQNDKQIQTAAQMSKVFGGWHQKSTTIMPTLKYKKTNLFIDGLDVNVYGTYNFGDTRNIDTLNRIYNWAGEYKDNSKNENGEYVPGGENSRSLYKFRNNLAMGSAGVNYAFMEGHSIGMNYVLSSFNRKGNDVLRPEEESYTKPQVLRKSTLGLGYKYDYKDRVSATVFAKRYDVHGKSSQRVDIYTNPHWETKTSEMNSTGYGIAAAWFLFSNLQVKASYEKTYRLPEGEEMFGDGINHVANKDLRPENSNNINAGLVLSQKIGTRHRFVLETNLIIRDASDFIRIDLVDNRTQSVNIRGVRNTGFDTDLRYTLQEIFSAGFNVTYQHLINTTKYETPGSTVVSPIYKDKIPNIPYLFGNAHMSLNLKKTGWSHANLSFSYYLNYVAEYYLKWPSLGNRREKSKIPEQVSHDVSATYTIKNGKYNVSAECRNLADARLYDNFLMQKPGRAFYLKLRYFLRK